MKLFNNNFKGQDFVKIYSQNIYMVKSNYLYGGSFYNLRIYKGFTNYCQIIYLELT